MKTKIYNNLIFSLLFVCSIWGGFYAGVAAAQTGGGQPPTTSSQEIEKGKPITLHLYSTIFGVGKELRASSTDREAINETVQDIFTRFFQIIFTLSGILMVVLLAVHGTKMIYAEFGGNVAGFFDAKKRVKSAAIGTAILLLSWVILNFIAPSLLRPRFFQTITNLQEVGQGANLYSNNLKIRDKNKTVKFDKSTGALTISLCPEITNDTFESQIESTRKSLQLGKADIPLQYAYQILYQRAGGTTVHTYDDEGSEAKFIACDKTTNKLGESIAIESPETVETIVAFPVVYIVVGETEEEAVGKKFWRGEPWRKQKSRSDILAALNDRRKEIIEVIAEHLSASAEVRWVNEAGSPEEVTHKFQTAINCDINGSPESGPGVKITFNTPSLPPETPSEVIEIIDKTQYRLEVKIGGRAYGNSQLLKGEWQKVQNPDSEKTFCLHRDLAGFKITPQFSTTNSSDVTDGIPDCYLLDRTTDTERVTTFSNLRKGSCGEN